MQSKFGVLSGSLPLLAMHTPYLLPVVGGYLLPCPVSAVVLTPTAGGHRCNRCPRLVHDFTQATAADVQQARAAAPDGRVCGRFRVAAPTAPAGFSRRLRWFMVALVLVVGRGLSAQQALAQVALRQDRVERPGVMANSPGIWIEQMPELRGGGGLAAVARAIQQHFSFTPIKEQKSTGKIYLSFWVNAEGRVEDVKIIRGSTPLIDSAAVRAVQALPLFIPGQQNSRPVGVSLTIPISYVKPD